MDAFYASVEQRDRPELRNKPIVVGGSPQSRGVVAAASYEARKFGIRSAMSCSRAYRLCPQAVFVKPRFEAYKEASQKMHRIFHEVTDIVEPLALDEAYLDVTENKLNEPSATRIASYIRARIKGQIQLTASAGVAPNKFLAKLGSEMQKPNGLVTLSPDKIESVLRSLPVEKLWGIGPASLKRLQAIGIFHTGHVRNFPRDRLRRALGQHADFIIDLANGIDHRKVSGRGEAKSRGAERTFARDLTELDSIHQVFRELSQELSESLEKRNLPGRTIQIKVRYSDFSTITRRVTLSSATYCQSQLYESALRLLDNTEICKRPVRLLGLSLSNFKNASKEGQLSFELN